jgi:acyl carrier protein
MSTLQELQELIHRKYGIDESALDPHASMRGKGLDSLTLAEFLFAVEDHFHIDMPDADPNIDTLHELAVVVDRILAAKTPA